MPCVTVEQILDQLMGAAVFSTLDATSGFWQIPLTDEFHPHNLHNAIWEILLQEASIWHHLGSGNDPISDLSCSHWKD